MVNVDPHYWPRSPGLLLFVIIHHLLAKDTVLLVGILLLPELIHPALDVHQLFVPMAILEARVFAFFTNISMSDCMLAVGFKQLHVPAPNAIGSRSQMTFSVLY